MLAQLHMKSKGLSMRVVFQVCNKGCNPLTSDAPAGASGGAFSPLPQLRWLTLRTKGVCIGAGVADSRILAMRSIDNVQGYSLHDNVQGYTGPVSRGRRTKSARIGAARPI